MLELCPRQLSFEHKMDQNVAKRLQVIPPRMLIPLMRVVAKKPKCPDTARLLSNRHMLACSRRYVPFGEPEVNKVDDVRLFTESDEYVFWLHVSVHEMLGVEYCKAVKDCDTY